MESKRMFNKQDGSNLPGGLAAPAQHALAGAGITSLEQLAEMSEAELSHLHGIGPRAVELLRREMAENGLKFKDS